MYVFVFTKQLNRHNDIYFLFQTKEHIVEKYGGDEHLQAPPKSLLLAQTEEYIEYSRSGKVIKGMEKPKARSIYEEDVYINNHTTVWGSYYNGGRWGYRCCKSFIKNSYCVGMKEPDVVQEVSATISTTSVNSEKHIENTNGTTKITKESEKEAHTDESSSSSSSSSSEDEEELHKAAIENKKSKKKLKKREKKRAKKLRKIEKKMAKSKKRLEEKSKEKALKEKESASEIVDDRKRPYNSMYDVKVPTEEDIEEWQRKRTREEDPMLQFMDK